MEPVLFSRVSVLQGLGPSCHTVLESEARFEAQDDVITLVPEVTAHQKLILMHKISSTQYYRYGAGQSGDCSVFCWDFSGALSHSLAVLSFRLSGIHYACSNMQNAQTIF